MESKVPRMSEEEAKRRSLVGHTLSSIYQLLDAATKLNIVYVYNFISNKFHFTLSLRLFILTLQCLAVIWQSIYKVQT